MLIVIDVGLCRHRLRLTKLEHRIPTSQREQISRIFPGKIFRIEIREANEASSRM